MSIRFFSNTWDKFLNSDKSKTFKKNFLQAAAGLCLDFCFENNFFVKKTQASTTPLGKWTFRIDKTSTSGDVLSLYISRNFQIMGMGHIMCSWLSILIDGPNHVLTNISFSMNLIIKWAICKKHSIVKFKFSISMQQSIINWAKYFFIHLFYWKTYILLSTRSFRFGSIMRTEYWWRYFQFDMIYYID